MDYTYLYFFNLQQYNKSIWQVVGLHGLGLPFLHSRSSPSGSHYLCLFSFLPSPSTLALCLSSLAPRHLVSLFSVSVESLCFSTRSSRVPSALGRQRWWRGASSPPMFSSFLFRHCWLHTCSHLESGETFIYTYTHTNTLISALGHAVYNDNSGYQLKFLVIFK